MDDKKPKIIFDNEFWVECSICEGTGRVMIESSLKDKKHYYKEKITCGWCDGNGGWHEEKEGN